MFSYPLFSKDVLDVNAYIQTITEIRPLSFIDIPEEEASTEKGSRNTFRKTKSSRKTYMNAYFD